MADLSIFPQVQHLAEFQKRIPRRAWATGGPLGRLGPCTISALSTPGFETGRSRGRSSLLPFPRPGQTPAAVPTASSIAVQVPGHPHPHHPPRLREALRHATSVACASPRHETCHLNSPHKSEAQSAESCKRYVRHSYW